MKCYRCNNYEMSFKKKVLPKWLFLEVLMAIVTILLLSVAIIIKKPYNTLFYGISTIFLILFIAIIVVNRTEHRKTRVKCKICGNTFWLKK